MINTLKLLLALFVFFNSSTISLDAKESKEEFEVKHADILEIIGDKIIINGNLNLKYGDAIISAPKGEIETNNGKEATKAIFSGRVKINLNDRKIEADKIIFVINNKYLIADGKTKSEFKDEKGKTIIITADYQKLNWNGEDANAKGNIQAIYEDTSVKSDEALIIYKGKKPSHAIFYGINKYATLERPSSFTNAKSITFDIQTKEISASGNVQSTIWPDEEKNKDEQDPVIVKADDVFIEDNLKNVIAKGSENLVDVTYQTTMGNSQKATLVKDSKTGKPDKIIFEGKALVTQPDKQLISEVVYFNFKDKNLISNTKTNIRPKTIIFKQKKDSINN